MSGHVSPPLTERALAVALASDADRPELIEGLASEIAEVRCAIQRAWTAEDASSVLALAAGLGAYCEANELWGEGRLWLERALAFPPAEDSLALSCALRYAGWLAYGDGDFASARLRFGEQRAIDLTAGRSTVAALNGMGACALREGDHLEARELFSESLEECARRGDDDIGFALSSLGLVAQALGDLDGALLYHEEASELARATSDDMSLCAELVNIGDVLQRRGETAGAREHYEQALALATTFTRSDAADRCLVALAEIDGPEAAHG